MNKAETYYQPELYYDDGTNIGWNLPSEMNSFEVFHTEDSCREWLEDNGYDPDDAHIFEYNDDDIEDHTYLDDCN